MLKCYKNYYMEEQNVATTNKIQKENISESSTIGAGKGAKENDGTIARLVR